MFGKKQSTPSSVRVRQPKRTVNDSFRRNNVVISRRQQEVAERQRSVTQRQLEKKQEVVRQKRKIKALLVVVMAFVLVFLYRSTIQSVNIETNASSKLTAEKKLAYENKILKDIKANTVFSQAWLLDKPALAQATLSEHPEIERVEFITSPFTTTLTADIRFRKAVFTWKDATGRNQFVDQNGVLFSENLDPTVNVSKLIKIEDQSGVVLEEGSPVLTATLVRFVGLLHSKIPALYGSDAQVERVIIPVSTREVDLKMSNVPYLIKFNVSRSLDEQVGEFATLLTFLQQNNILPTSYIDVRVPHKAFYK